MIVVNHRPIRTALALAVCAVASAACADVSPVAPPAEFMKASPDLESTLAQLRRVTARYHDVNAALADGFVEGPGCEVLGPETHIGIPYPNPTRLRDGVIDPSRPDVLLYEPGPDGRRTLVAVGLAIPQAMWSGDTPPEFMGATFQREDRVGIYGLHVWVWRENRNGMFAVGNPRITCDTPW